MIEAPTWGGAVPSQFGRLTRDCENCPAAKRRLCRAKHPLRFGPHRAMNRSVGAAMRINVNPGCKRADRRAREKHLYEGGNHTGSNGSKTAHVSVLTAHVSVLTGPTRVQIAIAQSLVFSKEMSGGDLKGMAGTTGLEPATSDVTVKHAVPSFPCSCYHLRRSYRFLSWTPGSKQLQRDDPITGVRTPLLWQYNTRTVSSLGE